MDDDRLARLLRTKIHLDKIESMFGDKPKEPLTDSLQIIEHSGDEVVVYKIVDLHLGDNNDPLTTITIERSTKEGMLDE